MSKTLWAVTSGSYSDYRVHVLLETEDQAIEVARAADAQEGCHDYAVESFPFYPTVAEITEPITIYEMSVVLWDDGRHDLPSYEEPVTRMEFQHYKFVPPKTRPRIRQVRAPVYKNKGARLDVTARTETMVRKAMNDRLMEHKALGARRVPEINP